MSKERPGILTLLIVLLTINALITGIHYILIFLKVIPIKGDIITVVEFTLADLVVAIIPSLIGAYGLWRLKTWGWVLAMILSGSYLHGMAVLLTRSVITSQYGFMNFVSIYFILFSVLLTIYLWQQRELFN
jgi:hypothetical protein